MHIELKRSSDKPLSKQIVQTFTDRIQSELLKPGTQLPSIRNLSRILHVSLVTVSKAYKELEGRGFIRCIQGKGCFVNSEKLNEAINEEEGSTAWQLSTIDYLPRAQMLKHFQSAFQGSSTDYRYQFHISSIHHELLPTEEIGKNIYQIILNNPTVVANYGPFQGDLELRNALSVYFEERGISVKGEDLLIVNGAQQGIDLIARTFVGPGDVVYMEAPTYSGAIDVFASRGAKIITVPVDNEGMKIDLLTKMCDEYPPKLIYTIPTYHNPTGTVMSIKRRVKLLQLAQSYNCIILEDDTFSDICFSKQPPRTIKSIDSSGHVIYVKTFSKILSPGCRISAINTSGPFLNRLIAAKTISDLGSPLVTQKAVLPFITSNRMNKHIKNLRSVLYSRCKLVLDLLKHHAPKGVTWTQPDGGLNIWVTLPSWASTNELFVQAQKQQIAILPGSVCYAGEPEYNHFRLSFSYLEDAVIKEGIIQLCNLLRTFLVDQSFTLNEGSHQQNAENYAKQTSSHKADFFTL
ncbi:MocR-like pyridoxine biosynthesis transcription factor PdxR [Virgibacillus sp. 6R]|uniref:MocR-like pyridoxine biosynthesis transcription factor PdxR n=1 Tax=Metabacillus sp. 22489 TaxID=3453928 RepID=UPI0011AB2C4E